MQAELTIDEESWREIAESSSPIASPVFEAEIAASRPLISRSLVGAKARDWLLDFGPVTGTAGSIAILTQSPQVYFRAEKIIATDDSSNPGYGTRIGSMRVGSRGQRPVKTGRTLTIFFSPLADANGITWDTCDPVDSISIEVHFEVACTFDLTLFGKAVLI